MSRTLARLFFALICLATSVYVFLTQGDAFADSRPVVNFNKAAQNNDAPSTMALRAQRRDLAAVKGLQWMDHFLDDEKHFRTMPFETYQFFHVCALTSANPQFQRIAKQTADKYAARLKKYCLEMNEPIERHDFLQLLEFISKHEHAPMDFTALIDKAKKNYAPYKSTADIYGKPIENLEQADWKDIFETLLYAYFLEKADTEFPDVFKVNYRLTDILKFLKNRTYVNLAEDTSEDKKKAIDDAFIMTHIAYMLSNYSQLRLYEKDAPWVYEYLRRNFDDILAIGHTDLIGECVDIFRSLGYTEEDNVIVRKGTDYLVNSQNADGAWGESGAADGSAYDKMHPTSCATWALRTRTFLTDTKYDRRIRSIVRELNRETKKAASTSFPPVGGH